MYEHLTIEPFICAVTIHKAHVLCAQVCIFLLLFENCQCWLWLSQFLLIFYLQFPFFSSFRCQHEQAHIHLFDIINKHSLILSVNGNDTILILLKRFSLFLNFFRLSFICSKTNTVYSNKKKIKAEILLLFYKKMIFLFNLNVDYVIFPIFLLFLVQVLLLFVSIVFYKKWTKLKCIAFIVRDFLIFFFFFIFIFKARRSSFFSFRKQFYTNLTFH